MSAHSRNEAMPPLALLAGGMATRLGPLTARTPKSLVTVAGEPFVAHQLRLFVSQGIGDIVVCSGHLGEQIEQFVGDGSRFACRVRYSSDGPAILGTGGAIRLALPLLGPRFWVMYGDSYLTAPFAPALAAFQTSRKPALMTVFANQDRWDRSNVQFSGGRILRYDKRTPQPSMQHIDYGLSLFSAEVFQSWPANTAFDLSEVQRRLVEEEAMAGYEVAERFYEIGSLAGLEETNALLTARSTAIASEEIPSTRTVSCGAPA
jgi:NDP-sugar pyrophosphorylase family protein